jgi:hypothetical protein
MSERPVVQVVRGNPSPEELAAVTALMSAAEPADTPPAPLPRGRWNDPARSFPPPLHPGPGAWRASAR